MNAHRETYCSHCDALRTFRRQRPNFTLNLAMTIGTVGLWGAIWAASAWKCRQRHWRCPECGFALRRT